MGMLDTLLARSDAPERPFLVGAHDSLSLRDIANTHCGIDNVAPGDVVALVGDIDRESIAALLALIDRRAIVMPLVEASAAQHSYFLEAGCADVLLSGGHMRRLRERQADSPLLQSLRQRGHAGLILFTSGSTGRPKAILHDFNRFLARYSLPRPALTTLNFLLFDHIGGLNTLFHTLYNNGVIVRPSGRTPDAVTEDIRNHTVALLPTTPTFLRLWALHGFPRQEEVPSLRLITYGTERMDQDTLTRLAKALPDVDIRQTYGMSELGILRVHTRSRDALWVSVGGEGVECRIKDGELHIRAQNRMEGYLNAPLPFDDEGWYHTGDLVECDGPWLRFTGRKDMVINVGGLKVMPAEVEHAALTFPGILFARARGGTNPLTGMHVELCCEPARDIQINRDDLARHLRSMLPPHAVPRRITIGSVPVGHRGKQL